MEVVRPAPAKAADLLNLALDNLGQPRRYWDKGNYATFEEQLSLVATSTTMYLGNLSFYTSEQHVYELARQSGPVKKVIMGLHRETKTPCGFAFVEYFTREACVNAELLLNGKKLENCAIKFEIDPGFKEGRQFGRGRGGGQVRDDFREDDNPERGGVGTLARVGLLPGQTNNTPTQPPIHGVGSFGPRHMGGDFGRGGGGFGGGAPPPLQAMPLAVQQPPLRGEPPLGPARPYLDQPLSSYPPQHHFNKRGRYDDARQSSGGYNSQPRRRGRSADGQQSFRGGGGGGRNNYNQGPRGGGGRMAPYANPPSTSASAPGAPSSGASVDEFGRDIDPQRRG